MDEFVAAESKDNGKPYKLAEHVDIPRAVSNFSFFASAIKHFLLMPIIWKALASITQQENRLVIVGCIVELTVVPLFLENYTCT